MDIGQVKGNVISTVRNTAMAQSALLLIVEFDGGQREVVADTVGAGVGDRILVSHGTAARLAIGDANSTIDAAITAIVDSVDVHTNT